MSGKFKNQYSYIFKYLKEEQRTTNLLYYYGDKNNNKMIIYNLHDTFVYNF